MAKVATGRTRGSTIKLSIEERRIFDEMKTNAIPDTKTFQDLKRLIRQCKGDRKAISYTVQSWWDERERRPQADEWSEVGGNKEIVRDAEQIQKERDRRRARNDESAENEVVDDDPGRRRESREAEVERKGQR